MHRLYAHPLVIAVIIAVFGAVVVWEVSEHHLFDPLLHHEEPTLRGSTDATAKKMVAHIDLTKAYEFLKTSKEPISAMDLSNHLEIQMHEAETILRILVDLDYAAYVNLDGRTKFQAINDPFAQPLNQE